MKALALGFTPHRANRVAPCKQANLAQLLLDLTLVRLLGALGQPLRRAIAWQLILGKSLWTLLADIVYRFSDGIGWLSAPPRDPLLRSVGRGIISVRRWHYTLGEAPLLLPRISVPFTSRSSWSGDLKSLLLGMRSGRRGVHGDPPAHPAGPGRQ